jgi:hypothetical protein
VTIAKKLTNKHPFIPKLHFSETYPNDMAQHTTQATQLPEDQYLKSLLPDAKTTSTWI